MKNFFLLFLSIIIVSSCNLKDDITKKDSPTTGKLTLFYDEGLKLQIENQINTFKSIYQHAEITLVSSDEKTCIESLFKDSCKAIAISRALTDKELETFRAKNILVETSVVAKSAIAFIVQKDFPDSTLSITEISDLLQGNDSTLIPGQRINLIFDNQNSGNTRQLKDSLIPNSNFGKNISAEKNTEDLIKKIAGNANSVGVCDYAWLSDQDDPRIKEFLKNIKVLAISKDRNQIAYMPDQSNLATMNYPFTRTVCIVRRSSDFSLGKGVETFIAGPIGQLMFLKQGLAPNRQEERVVEIDMTPLVEMP